MSPTDNEASLIAKAFDAAWGEEVMTIENISRWVQSSDNGMVQIKIDQLLIALTHIAKLVHGEGWRQGRQYARMEAERD